MEGRGGGLNIRRLRMVEYDKAAVVMGVSGGADCGVWVC